MSINIKQTTRQVEVTPREEVVETFVDTMALSMILFSPLLKQTMISPS